MVGSLDFDGVSTDLLNIFDFPLEDVEVGAEKDDWNDIQLLDLPSDISMGLSSVFCSGLQNDSSKEIKNISFSYDRTCRLNRSPSAAETTSSGGIVLSDDSSSDIKHIHLFKTSSPVSILESNSSCFAENPRTADQKSSIVPVKRPRSKKRSRPSNFDRLYTLPFIAALERLRPSAASESDLGAPQVGKMFKTAKKAMKKKRATPHPIGIEVRNVSSQQSGEIKKCTHCQMTTTPQWREGPMGPKTLCNACGVRFRSGRLFPEYRPAASPTFVPSLHSNSHKKVIEMRNKASQRANSSRAGVELYLRPQAGNSVRQLIV